MRLTGKTFQKDLLSVYHIGVNINVSHGQFLYSLKRVRFKILSTFEKNLLARLSLYGQELYK